MGDLHHKYYMTGGSDVNLERQHQADLGYDLDHDYANHSPAELMRIAACYLDVAACDMEGVDYDSPHTFWPENTDVPWKPEDSALGNAVKGGAFVMAALDLIHVQNMEQSALRVDTEEPHTHE